MAAQRKPATLVEWSVEWTMGDRLRKARRSAHLTTAQMAAAIGISRQAVNAYELDQRQPKIPTVQRWAEATGAPFQWLCLGDASTMWYSPFAA